RLLGKAPGPVPFGRNFAFTANGNRLLLLGAAGELFDIDISKQVAGARQRGRAPGMGIPVKQKPTLTALGGGSAGVPSHPCHRFGLHNRHTLTRFNPSADSGAPGVGLQSWASSCAHVIPRLLHPAEAASMNPIVFALRHPVSVLVAMVALIGGGVLA